ncbi:MAG: flagellar FlbD family protein [Acidimicrobiales bacterium]
MIELTRPNGSRFAINSDLIERAEAMPATVVTLVDGTPYLVNESVPEVIERVLWFRASILATANRLETGDAIRPDSPLRLVPDVNAER